jgi:PDZ domain-containing protein
MLKRRGITVMLGAALVALLTWQALAMDVAYVVMGPGPTEDVLGAAVDDEGVEHQIITADAEFEHQTDGHLRLTTVRVRQQISLAEALRFWWSDEHAVVPRELVYPADQTDEEIAAEQEAEWVQSQVNAEQAALAYLGQPAIVTVTADSGDLREGDVILDVDGTVIESLRDLQDFAEGETDLTVERDGEKVEVDGVDLAEVALDLTRDDPYDVAIDTQALKIGGPSAGLIFALGIIDRLTEDSLIGGLSVAGTGEIDADGNVGPIGGVQQKVNGAHTVGAEVFLAPAANCSDAVAVAPDGMTIVRVETLADAVSALEALAAGGTAPSC